jgi:hypothetical protein
VAGPSAQRDYPEDGDYPVTLTVLDTAGSTASHTITVTVTNVAPTVLTASDVTDVEGSAVQFAATFTDPGVLDGHSAVIDWGDGTTSVGVVSGTGGQGTVTGSHIYADDGQYPIRVTVTDQRTAGQIWFSRAGERIPLTVVK